jgi:polyribonucleotide nucleotidyltransferase
VRRNQAVGLNRRTIFGLRELLFGKKQTEHPTVTPTEIKNTTIDQSKIQAEATQAPLEPVKHEGSKEETIFSVGKYARLADAAVMATCGKSMVLTTTVSNSAGKRGKDFLPLMVDYRVKYYATGRIPDTARRIEFSGNDEEILQSRVIDRVIRPLFPRGYNDETQVIATVHSFDEDNDPLVVAINNTSAALCVSDIPWNGPVGCVRVIEVDGILVVNPTAAQKEKATLDILYAANEERTIMIEADGKEIPEGRMAEALQFAHDAIGPIIQKQKELAITHGKSKRPFTPSFLDEKLFEKAKQIGLADAKNVLSSKKNTKVERQQGERQVQRKIINGLRDFYPEENDDIFHLAAHDVFQLALRDQILKNDKKSRFDGRSSFIIRPLEIETDVLPMAHGSSVFARGDTQTLCSVTLGPLNRGLKVRSATVDHSIEVEMKHAMLHYEFPPYCVNETGRIGGTNRRMIGHGALAEKAIVPVIPSIDEFPYTVRMTSETMGSDGSSSMASVCGVSLALLDAGVPIKTPVAGISIGLITEGDPFDGQKKIKNYRLITDILGVEDHYGDMDFKIAGTKNGITAIQLDVKLPGVPLNILCEGIEHAKTARSHILRKMNDVLPEPRKELKNGASANGQPHTSLDFDFPVGSVGLLIGTGGANIRVLEQKTGCMISIDRAEGRIRVVGPAEELENAKNAILDFISMDGFFKKGSRYTMRVVEILDFGAMLESTTTKNQQGFVHISELAHKRVENIRDELKVGDELEFECIQEGVSGRMSRKVLLEPPAGSVPAESSSPVRHRVRKPRAPGALVRVRSHAHPHSPRHYSI